MELYQKTLTDKRHFKILEDRIFIKTSSFKENLEYYIKFDELGFDVFRKKEKGTKTAFFFFLAFDAMYIALLINSISTKDKMIWFWIASLLFFIPMTILSYMNRYKNLVYLTGGNKVLEMMNDKPDETTVKDFVGKIHDAMRMYYKNKYALIDVSIPKEYSISQFKWLTEIKAITESEYKQLIENLETQHLL